MLDFERYYHQSILLDSVYLWINQIIRFVYESGGITHEIHPANCTYFSLLYAHF